MVHQPRPSTKEGFGLIVRSISLQSNVENFSPQIIRQVAKELSGLVSDPPEGIKVFPNEDDITEIHATIEGPCK